MIQRLYIKNNTKATYNIAYLKHFVPNASMHFHDFYELEIILSGTGTTTINQTTYEVKPGSIFLLTPSDIHCYTSSDDSGFEIANLIFTAEAIEYSAFLEIIYPMTYVAGNIGKKLQNKLLGYIDEIVNEYESENQFKKKYISMLLSCILIELFRLNKNTAKPFELSVPFYMPIQKALYYLRTHFKENISLTDVTTYANISNSTFCKKFPQYVGMGFKEYLTDLRLEYAKMLIINTSEPITDIASYSGFNSQTYFQQVFLKKYGSTPKNFRNQNTTLH